MNLVAKEYVAAQDPDDPGVLILSRFAGAAAECTAALLVNPYDPEAVATSIAHALSMPLEERRTRHEALFQVISENDLKSWGELFLASLTQKADLPLWREQLGLRRRSAPTSLSRVPPWNWVQCAYRPEDVDARAKRGHDGKSMIQSKQNALQARRLPAVSSF